MNRKHYHAGCLKVLQVLAAASEAWPRYASLTWIAGCSKLSESGAAARFRQLRTKPYGCVVECKQLDVGVWGYRLVHAPKRLLKLAREMQQ